ncbi:GumC family protein [Methylobacterium sp. A54F]
MLQRAGRAKVVADPGNLAYIIAVFRLRRRTILLVTLLGFTLAAGYLALATPQYRAAARVLIDFRRLAVIGQDQFASNYKVNDAAVESQRIIIDSPAIAAQVIRALALEADPELQEPISVPGRLLARAWPFEDAAQDPDGRFNRLVEIFNERLSAERIGISYVVEVAFLSQDPAKAMRIANAVAAAYVQDQLTAKLDAATIANDWFQKRVRELDAQASEAEKIAVEYRTKNRIMLVDGRFVDEQQVGELSTQLTKARSDRAQASAKLTQVETLIASGGSGAIADEFTNGVIVALRQKRAELLRRIAEAVTRFGGDHESIERLRGDLRATDAAIADEWRRIADGYRSDAMIARAREATLETQLTEAGDRSAKAQETRIELTQLQSVAQTLKTMRENFSSRYIEASQEQSFPITEARVVSPAALPDKPTLPKVTRTLISGLAGGSAIGCILALLGEVLTRRTRTRQQLETMISAPCVAVVGRIPPADGVDGLLEAAVREPGAPLSEAMRSIRLAVDARRHGGAEHEGTVVAFASPAAGDGTTTIAANFAGTLAQRDLPVLLIDLDLRKRTLSRRLEAAEAPDAGTARADLLDVLSGRAEFRAAVRRQSRSGVDTVVIQHSDGFSDPGRWLASAALTALLKAVRREYRYVVLDLPPIIPVGDARAIATLIDAFLLVVTWNRTTLDEVAEAMSLNPILGGKLVGAVLNKADPTAMERLDDLMLARSIGYLTPAAAR